MKIRFLMVAMPAATIFVMFMNHYLRDTVGALEKQMETDLGLKPSQYDMLNSLFFMPNIIAPLFTGSLCDTFGRPSRFLLFCALLGAFGNLLFVLGAQNVSIPLFYLGRFLCGSTYEIIDTVPIIILGPMFKKNWGLIVGMMNGFLRLGTVLTFALSPLLYREYGVMCALWAGAIVGGLGVISALIANILDVRLTQLEEGEGEGGMGVGGIGMGMGGGEEIDGVWGAEGEGDSLLRSDASARYGTGELGKGSGESGNKKGSSGNLRGRGESEGSGGGGEVALQRGDSHFRNLLRAESFRGDNKE